MVLCEANLPAGREPVRAPMSSIESSIGPRDRAAPFERSNAVLVHRVTPSEESRTRSVQPTLTGKPGHDPIGGRYMYHPRRQCNGLTKLLSMGAVITQANI